jgi:predicted AAA+ superfamily ATPase
MDIVRLIETDIIKHIGKQKVIMLYGTRRTGKTTIIRNIAKRYGAEVLMLQGEDIQVMQLLAQRTIANYTQLTRGKKLIMIDEADCRRAKVNGI